MKYFAALLLILVFPLNALGEPSERVAEYMASITKIVDKNVTWPKDRITEGNGKLFVIAVIGKSPVTNRLKKLNSTKTSTGKEFKIRVVTPDLLPSNANMIVITEENSGLFQSVLKKLAGTSTLTVGCSKGFGELGAMFNFYTDASGGKSAIRFEVNKDAVESEGIKIASDLLNRARVISGK